jgi:hypothetical protein
VRSLKKIDFRHSKGAYGCLHTYYGVYNMFMTITDLMLVCTICL